MFETPRKAHSLWTFKKKYAYSYNEKLEGSFVHLDKQSEFLTAKSTAIISNNKQTTFAAIVNNN